MRLFGCAEKYTLRTAHSALDYKHYACKQYAHCAIDCKLYKISGQGVTWKLTKYVWGSVQNVCISVLQDKKETCKSSKVLVGYNLMVKDP